MTLREQLELTESQMQLLTKAAKGDTKLLFKAKKSLDRTMEITREDWPIAKRRKYVKDYIRNYTKLSPPVFVNREVQTMEGSRFEALKKENDKIIADLQTKRGNTEFDCQVCGKVNFHSNMAHQWRVVKNRYKTG